MIILKNLTSDWAIINKVEIVIVPIGKAVNDVISPGFVTHKHGIDGKVVIKQVNHFLSKNSSTVVFDEVPYRMNVEFKNVNHRSLAQSVKDFEICYQEHHGFISGFNGFKNEYFDFQPPFDESTPIEFVVEGIRRLFYYMMTLCGPLSDETIESLQDDDKVVNKVKVRITVNDEESKSSCKFKKQCPHFGIECGVCRFEKYWRDINKHWELLKEFADTKKGVEEPLEDIVTVTEARMAKYNLVRSLHTLLQKDKEYVNHNYDLIAEVPKKIGDNEEDPITSTVICDEKLLLINVDVGKFIKKELQNGTKKFTYIWYNLAKEIMIHLLKAGGDLTFSYRISTISFIEKMISRNKELREFLKTFANIEIETE